MRRRRGTLTRNASIQSNKSLAVSMKVMEMPKAPPLRPKAKDESQRAKQSEVGIKLGTKSSVLGIMGLWSI